MKVLYNLTLTSASADDEKSVVDRLVVLIRRLLLSSPLEDPAKKRSVVVNVMNLLTTVPPSCFGQLIVSSASDGVEQAARDDSGTTEREEEEMAPVAVLLALLDALLTETQEGNVFELLFPTLHGMARMAKANSRIRRYLRRRVLPRLGRDDLLKKPEEGQAVSEMVHISSTVPKCSSHQCVCKTHP